LTQKYPLPCIALILLGFLLVPATPSSAHAQGDLPVVRAVLFYSPKCGHCQYVITEILPPLFEKYGEQLQIFGVDITQPQGQALFLAALQKFNLESSSVPFLVIGNTYLFGSLDIPERLPGLIETYLAQGGVDWPDIPGLRETLSLGTEDPTATPPATPTALQASPVPAAVSPPLTSPTAMPGLIMTGDQNPNWNDQLARDPLGNTLAILVLVVMLGSVLWTLFQFSQKDGIPLRGNWAWLIPVLCVVGFGVAVYLAYVETAQVTAVCGPVGDCNAVQQSEYARLFGILPVGVLGLIGYVAIIIAWMFARYTNGWQADLATLSLFLMTGIGTLFSIYLTYLEPFVIGATCAWCLTSAILMTILMLLSVRPAKAAFSRLAHPRSLHREQMRIGVHDD
jgi:uncharacterized membrane protein